MFINTARIPAFDRAPGTSVKIMVSRVAGTPNGKESPPAKFDADLAGTYWKLTEINGKQASLGAGQKELNMVFTGEGNRARGFSGCNRFSGTYAEKKDGALHFGPMAATMMACVDSMEQERSFLKALGKVKRYTIEGDNLALYSGKEQLILRFTAVYLK